MRLHPVTAVATRDSLLAGELGAFDAAPGWPHQDTLAGLSFLDAGGQVFLVIDDDGRIAGECGTKTPPRNGRVEIGYGLAGPSRGRGLGTNAVRALVAHLEAAPAVSVVEAEVHVGNPASQRLLERLGFTRIQAPTGDYLRYATQVTRLRDG